MGKAEPRRARSVVGIDEDSEEDDKPLAQTLHPRQSHDGGDAAANRPPKRQRTASDDGGRRARTAAATEASAHQQHGEPANEAGAAAAADEMDVNEQQQQQEAEAAAHPQQCSSKEPDTPFAAIEGAFPASHHSHSAGDDAAAAGDAAPAAAGSARPRHSGRQQKAGQQQLQPERTLSRNLSSRPSYKLGTKAPTVAKTSKDRAEDARMPWHGADENWGDGFVGMRHQLPPGAESATEVPQREVAVGWGFWMFYKDDPEEGEQDEEQLEQDEQRQQGSESEEEEKQSKEPVPGQWWRGMVWWYSAKEAAYRLVMEDGEYVPKHTVAEMDKNIKDKEVYFIRPPCNWPRQQSGMSADAAHAEQQEQHEHEAAASGKRAKQQKHTQEQRTSQQQQRQQVLDEQTMVAAAEAPAAAPAPPAAAAEREPKQLASAAAVERPPQPAKQQHHHRMQQQQRPQSGQLLKKPSQQQQPGPRSQGQKQRKHSAGAKPQPPASPAVPSAEAVAAAAAATAAAAGLSPQQRPRSSSVLQQQQQQPDLSGLSADAAKLARCLLNLREGTEQVRLGLALQKQALQDLPADLTPEEVLALAREVKSAYLVGKEKLGGQLLGVVKQLATDHWNLRKTSQEVHSGAEQLYQQMLPGRKPPGTPSKAAAAAKAVGEWAAAAAGGSSMSLQDMDQAAAAAAAGGLSKRGRDGSIKQEHAAEQQSPSVQQDADDDTGTAAGVDGAGKDAWDFAHFQSLVPIHNLEDPLRNRAVALLSAALQPPAAASPFALAHELEAMLHNQHGLIGPGKHMYLKHMFMIWCVLGGRELAAAADAAQRARAAAAEGRAEDAATAAAAAEKAAAAARAELEGLPGVADAAAVRTALLEGAASVEDLFAMTRTQLGFDQQRDK